MEADTANHHPTDASDPESQRIESSSLILSNRSNEGMMVLPTEKSDSETDNSGDINSVSHTSYSDSSYPDAHTNLSSCSGYERRPGAYRIGPDHADEVTCSSEFALSQAEQEHQEPQAIQAIDVLDSDLEALVDAEAARVLRQEREQQPVIEAVTRVDNAGQSVPLRQENEEFKVFGLPKWCIKWLFLGILMGLVVVAIYFVARPQPPTKAPTAAPTMVVTAKDPINTMFDLLRDYVPDIAFASSQLNSTEYRAVNWLAQNNYTSSLPQGYAMVVLYLGTGGDTGLWYNSSLWLSDESICDWYGVVCNGTNITTLNLGKCGEILNTVTLLKRNKTAPTDL
jgi:hypothetical protein